MDIYTTEFWKFADEELGKQIGLTTFFGMTKNYRYRIDRADNPTKHHVTYLNSAREEIEQDLQELKKLYDGKKGPALEIQENLVNWDMVKYLEENGWYRVVSTDLRVLEINPENMARLEDLSRVIDDTYTIDEVSNREISEGPTAEFFELYKNGFPKVPVDHEIFRQTFKFRDKFEAKHKNLTTNIVIYQKGKPIAMASIIEEGEVMGQRIALLGGALTHEEHRRKGLYRSLLMERVKLAEKHGINLLWVQANIETSSPILGKYGFKKVHTNHVYVNPAWMGFSMEDLP